MRDSMTRCGGAATILIATFTIVGCAEPGFPEAARQTIDRAGAGEGNLCRVRSIPTMRFDDRLLSDLDAALSDDDLASARPRAKAVLESSRRLGAAAVQREIDRLDHAELADLWRRHLATETPPADLHAAVYARLVESCHTREIGWIVRVDQADSIGSLRAVLRELRGRLEPLAVDAGRSGRTALYALASYREPDADALAAAEEAFRYAGTPEWYEPDIASARRFVRRAEGDYERAELLLKLAPTILQERLRHPPYDGDDDRVGTIIVDADDGTTVHVDASEPAVYAYSTDATVNDQPRVQLVYVCWYPAHPPLEPPSAFSGPLDGFTLRITLDSQQRPAIFETVRNSGDEHRVWVSSFIERDAATHFGGTLFGAGYAVERAAGGTLWRVAGLVETPVRPDTGPIVRVRAATHLPIEISYDRAVLVAALAEDAPPTRYQLLPYDVLEGQSAGMPRIFDARGLVIGADRPNGARRASSGDLAPGRPRQRGTQRLEDGDHFDDPRLLERRLRLPPDF